MKRQIKPNLLPLLGGLVLLIWIISGFFYYQISHPAGESTQAIAISIPPGATLKQISSELESHNLIRSASAFRLLANIRKKQTHIQVGEYELNQSMLPMDILKAITSGKTVLHPVTIPEGYRITEIAELLAEKISINKEEFIKETRSKDLMKTLNITSDSLEGYLFPETYHFSKHTPEQKIVQAMLNTFKQRITNRNILDQIKNQICPCTKLSPWPP